MWVSVVSGDQQQHWAWKKQTLAQPHKRAFFWANQSDSPRAGPLPRKHSLEGGSPYLCTLTERNQYYHSHSLALSSPPLLFSLSCSDFHHHTPQLNRLSDRADQGSVSYCLFALGACRQINYESFLLRRLLFPADRGSGISQYSHLLVSGYRESSKHTASAGPRML